VIRLPGLLAGYVSPRIIPLVVSKSDALFALMPIPGLMLREFRNRLSYTALLATSVF
jgi:hypothetical protein